LVRRWLWVFGAGGLPIMAGLMQSVADFNRQRVWMLNCKQPLCFFFLLVGRLALADAVLAETVDSRPDFLYIIACAIRGLRVRSIMSAIV
jgi:hypothetical protein